MADTSLINAALQALGEDPIPDGRAAGNKIERAAYQECDRVRRELLQKQRWTAALKYSYVDPDADAAVLPPYAKVGALPGDFLGMWETNCGAGEWTVLAFGDGDELRRRIAWQSGDRLTISYGADIPHVLMDPLLARAAASRLAATIANNKTERAGDLKAYRDMALQHEMEAAARDAVNRREAPLLGSNWDPASAIDELERRGSW